MSTAPPVAFFTSSAKRRQLTTWKLPSGQTLASGSFIAACARTMAGAITIAPAAVLSAVLRRKVMDSLPHRPISGNLDRRTAPPSLQSMGQAAYGLTWRHRQDQ